MRTVKDHNYRWLIGVFLILAGILFLANNFGYIPYHVADILFSWPMILVAIGVFNLLKRDYVPAFILLTIAAFFLLPDIFYNISRRDLFRFWPVLVIAGGIGFVFRRSDAFNVNNITVSSDEIIDEVNIFGGGTRQVDSTNFKGGKITSLFGGSEIYFDRCKLSEKGAVIDMVNIFGGSKIVVPRDWNIKTEVVSIFGGFSDKRISFGDQTADPSKTLVIKGVAIFGGAEVRSS